MIIDICNNPVIIALLMGILTYLYVWWSDDQQSKKDPDVKRTNAVVAPLVVTIITLILAYGYNEMSGNNKIVESPLVGINADVRKLSKEIPAVLSSDSAKEFHLISKGLNIPNNLKLPDVFIETI